MDDDNIVDLHENAMKVMDKELIPDDNEKDKFISIDFKEFLIKVPIIRR